MITKELISASLSTLKSRDGNPISFNPFLVGKNKHGEYEISKDKIVFLISLITILWKKTSEGETLNKEEQSILTSLLEKYYVDVNNNAATIPRLDRFMEFIEKFKEDALDNAEIQADLRFFNIDSFMEVLKTFTTGVYKDVLNSDATETIFDNKPIYLDLVGIKKDPILPRIVALLITELTFDKIRISPTSRKVIMIDEAWSMVLPLKLESQHSIQDNS